MTELISRRQSLAALAVLPFAPIVTRGPDNEKVSLEDLDFDNIDGATPPELAEFVATWELSAQQNNQPETWRTMHYVTSCQWGRERFAVVGVGTFAQTRRDCARIVARFGDDVQAAAFTKHGRSFAVVVAGRLSPEVRREVADC